MTLDRRDEVAAAYERGEEVATLALRYEVRAATIRTWLKEAGVALRYRGLRRVAAGPYRAEPRTEKARRVQAVIEANPGEKIAVLAALSGASPSYVSRLAANWKAKKQ